MKNTSYPLYQQISAFKIFFKYLFKVTFFIQLSDDKVSLIQILTFILELKKTFFFANEELQMDKPIVSRSSRPVLGLVYMVVLGV